MPSQWAARTQGRPLKAVCPTTSASMRSSLRPTGRRRSRGTGRPTRIRLMIVQQARTKTATPATVARATTTAQVRCTIAREVMRAA